MHELPANQAAGLQGLVQPSGARLMAMVSHGDEKAELPLLWRLCWSLADLGYAVTVLDATTFESDSNPGLHQLLDNAYWHSGAHLDAPAWTVVPSGKGIQDLCSPPIDQSHNLQRLGTLFAHDSVVILYSRAEWLVPLMGDSGVAPLLAVSPDKTSLLTSYLALKRLLMNGKLEPTIVNMLPQSSDDGAAAYRHRANAASLGDCAKNFLNYDVKAITLTASGGDDRSNAAIQRLALWLMESALPFGPDSATMEQQVASNYLSGMDRFAGSH